MRLKFRLHKKRKDGSHVLSHCKMNDKCYKPMHFYGNTVSRIYPLLDPDKNEEQRKKLHKTWFENANELDEEGNKF